MAVQYFCDRCKKEIGKMDKVYQVELKSMKRMYDLCTDCFTKVKTFIETV